jgi:endonuclease/exonuclease/phosphatase family metal-dependent hydrolase
VRVSDAAKAQFTTKFSVKLGGVVQIDVPRGWVSVEAELPRTKRTKAASFRFVDTHLESFGDPGIRTAQAKELFATGGPYDTDEQLVTVGDFNSGGPKDRVGTGLTKPGDEGAYNALIGFGLTNLGTRQTCCFDDVFEAAALKSPFDHTVDHVFAKPKVKQLDAYVTGSDPRKSRKGLVASDHGGLVSRLRLK